MTKDGILDDRGTKNQLRPIILWVEVEGQFLDEQRYILSEWGWDMFGWWMGVSRYFFRMSGVYFRWVVISRDLLSLGGILLKKH